jgi:hypothetical protein
MKRPSFQFYPSDWLRDTALRSCSTGARGLWIDMICFMHEGEPYGHLKVKDKVILTANLSRMVGETLDVVEGWLLELFQAGVYDTTENGVIFSKRMVRDENLRQQRAAGGIKGGNPALMDKGKVNLMVISEDKQKPTPSSSSSSSSSIKNTKKSAIAPRPDDVVEQVWIDWVALRKRKGTTISETAIQGARDEAAKIGWTLEQFLVEWCTRGSQGLKADWVLEKQTASQKAQSNMHQLTRGQTAPVAKPFWANTDILEVENEPRLLR